VVGRADQTAQLAGHVPEFAAPGGRAAVGQDLGDRLGQPRADEHLRVLILRHVGIDDLHAALRGDLGGQLRDGPRAVAAQFVHRVILAVGEQHGDVGAGVVLAGRRSHPARARGAEDRAVLQRGRERGGVVLGVPAVPQQRERHARVPDELLGGLVLGGQQHGRRIRAQQAGVGEQPDPCGLRGVDGGGVLRHPAPHLAARDQQQLVRARERGGEGLRAFVVGLAHLHAAGGQVGSLLRTAYHGHHLVGGDGLKEGVDGEAAKLSGGPGDYDHVYSSQLFRALPS